ncbi:MAG: fasciclin domain-containing protein, partial [Spirosomaceae bacterium]|nr:fasciclin domain-containing protein [Spirosomataceae bacterium]
MKKTFKSIITVLSLSAIAFVSNAQSVMVGGAAMYPNKNIIENAVNSKDHTTLVAAVKAAGLVDALSGDGPFTVFAPENSAFDKLPEGTVATLVKPENKGTLTTILTYHVLSGKYDAATLMEAIKMGKGKAMMKTLQGEELTFMMKGKKKIEIMDAKGGTATVTIPNVYQSNGVIHSIDTVLM